MLEMCWESLSRTQVPAFMGWLWWAHIGKQGAGQAGEQTSKQAITQTYAQARSDKSIRWWEDVHEGRRLVHNVQQRIEGRTRQVLQCIHALSTYSLLRSWLAWQPGIQIRLSVGHRMAFQGMKALCCPVLRAPWNGRLGPSWPLSTWAQERPPAGRADNGAACYLTLRKRRSKSTLSCLPYLEPSSWRGLYLIPFLGVPLG